VVTTISFVPVSLKETINWYDWLNGIDSFPTVVSIQNIFPGAEIENESILSLTKGLIRRVSGLKIVSCLSSLNDVEYKTFTLLTSSKGLYSLTHTHKMRVPIRKKSGILLLISIVYEMIKITTCFLYYYISYLTVCIVQKKIGILRYYSIIGYFQLSGQMFEQIQVWYHLKTGSSFIMFFKHFSIRPWKVIECFSLSNSSFLTHARK
jgi:hypothetical protein